GSSAKGYDDVTSEENVEAIEVLQAVGIMTGDDNSNFNPTQNVTRNEMAVIMSNLMDYRVATYRGTSPFTDVPEWAEPYVAACYTNGIIAGYSATTFGGSDPVVTSQATLMILKALGYFQYSTDFGDDWQLATINQANKVDLLVDVDSAVRVPMTRNDVAQLVLNGLETGMVEVDDSDKMNIVVGEVQITSGTNYVYTTSREKYAEAIKKDTANVGATSTAALNAPIVELGEKLYQGDLRKDEAEDAFGRPSNNWVYLNKEIGKYAEEADYEWTGKVTSKAIYDAVGRTATDYDWVITIDGEDEGYADTFGGVVYSNRNEDDRCFLRMGMDGTHTGAAEDDESLRTGNGVVTQVFVDSTKDEEKVHVAVMHRYAAEVLRVDETDGTITLSDLSQWGEAAAKDEFEATGYAEDDVVIYTWAEGKIQEVYPAERMEGEVSRVRVETNEAGYGDNFVADGETYNYNHTMKKADKLVSENVNNNVVAYLDANGYVAYIDQSAVTYDYAYVLSIGTDGDSYGGTNKVSGDTYYARLVLTDGSLVKAQVDVKKQAASNGKTVVENTVAYWQGQIVSYSEDSKGVYTLSSTKDDTSDTADTYAVGTGLDIESGVASFTAGSNANRTRYSANSQTVFILATPDENDLDDYNFSVYTGIANVPDVEGKAETVMAVSTGNKTGSVAKVVYIEDAETSGEDVIFIRTDREAKEQRDSELGSYYELNAWIDGERTTLNVKKGTSAADVLVRAQGTDWMAVNSNRAIVAAKSLTYNSDDLVTSVKLYSPYDASTGDGYITGTGYDDTENETVVLADGSYSWDRDTLEAAQYNNKNESGAFETLRVTGMRNDGNDLYLAVLDGDVITGLCVRYVKDGEGEFEGGAAPEPTEKDYTVESNLTGVKALEFAVKDTKPTSGADVEAYAADDWSDSVSAKKDQWIVVKAANGDKIIALAASNIMDKATYKQASVTGLEQVPTTSGYFVFQMPEANLIVTDVTVATVEAEHVFVYGDTGNEAIHIKLKSGTAPTEEALIRFAMDAVNANTTEGDKHGWTASLRYGIESGQEKLIGLTIRKGNVSADVDDDNIKANAGNVWATIDGQVVVSASDGTTTDTDIQIKTLTGYVGVTAMISVQHADGTVDCYTNASSETTDVVDGDVIISVEAETLTRGNPTAPAVTRPAADAEDKNVNVVLSGSAFQNLPDLSRIMGCAETSSGSKPFPTDVVNYNILGNRKLAILDFEFPVTNGKYVKIEVVNNAQMIYDQDDTISDNVKTARDGTSTISASSVALSTLVWDDGEPIVIRVYESDSDVSGATTPTYTITFNTIGVTFAD
ncbi:MAG: S-layer homology domain-containing protein, partial [Lawsonibacter sp.]|nr:S-layer homology domain-containing protein [Lawsonibacter sp.]